MSRIRGKNTKPELLVRSALHAMGFRFRLHVRRLPGSPDLVLRKYKVAIFVNGCFWHGHGCRLSKFPVKRAGFWRKKISDTRSRDLRAIQHLQEQGWRVVVLWECALRTPSTACSLPTRGNGTVPAQNLEVAMRAKPNFFNAINAILPVQSPSPKIFRLTRRANQWHHLPRLVPQRGGSRSSRTRGGMRWTRWCRKPSDTLTAFAEASAGSRPGEASWRRRELRTAKSCGPDAPTLASSWRDDPAQRRWQESPVAGRSPGRARNKPLKPLRREGRIVSVNLW